ncbi:MAG: GNAT family N-acetyltransferase [Gammaproteobacteria bacterium]|nr:GNAT family N-acetyltransferase [Gammaproteobacteria bacterium]MBU1722992.1 GNAT family N-acetyltransferase [Gammaproteobacteria bacterium]MBU2004985.1 GNAT family N-acetyltransferase [Gammaproteobacteria bacterium]
MTATIRHDSSSLRPQAPQLRVELATTPEDVYASQRLRYEIFAREQGAQLESAHEGIDRDYYDDFCHHLLVRKADTNEVVGSTRILTTENARKAGSFYSENEFDLRSLFPLPGNAIEIGRTCIHPDFRNGAGIGMLWLGLAQFMEMHKVDFMFGCASISMNDGGAQASAIMNEARSSHLAPEHMRVRPLVRLLPTQPAARVSMPPLLKAYLKLGAWVAGEPCLDPDFNVADVFILLDVNNLNTRYHRHFVQGSLQRNPVSNPGQLQRAA